MLYIVIFLHICGSLADENAKLEVDLESIHKTFITNESTHKPSISNESLAILAVLCIGIFLLGGAVLLATAFYSKKSVPYKEFRNDVI